MTKLKPNQFLIDGHIITEIPLLFQTEMVQAVVEDRKTQTRRTRGLEDVKDSEFGSWKLRGVSTDYDFPSAGAGFTYYPKETYISPSPLACPCPYGKPGDLLWVRETWCKIEAKYYFKSDGAEDELRDTYNLDQIKWKPSIHMPKSAARIWLMVDEIRVERLRDITDRDAIAEGILTSGKQYYHYLKDKWGPSPIHSFQTLWQSINGPGSWDANPWVWVVKFCMLSSSGRPTEEMIRAGYNHFTKEVTNG